MSLEQSAVALAERVKEEFRMLSEEEDNARIRQPTGLNITVFKELRGKISLYALRMVEGEWLNLTDPTRGFHTELDNECNCPTRLRFSLPCRHQLFLLHADEPIPLGLVHPRWWLAGPVASRDWKPTYAQTPLIISPKKPTMWSTFDQIATQHARLVGEEQQRFLAQITSFGERLIEAGVQHEQMAALPVGQMDPKPKKHWNRLKGENSRALIASELLDKAEKAAQKEQKKKAKDNEVLRRRQEEVVQQHQLLETHDAMVVAPQTVELDEVLVPGTPPQPNPPTPQPVQELFEACSALPCPSTAPPAVSKEPMKRTRGKTLDFVALNGGKRTRKGA
jgi:hypothetical protein